MPKAYLIEDRARTLGLLVFAHRNCAFFAVDPQLAPLDGAIFASAAQAERAVRRQARALLAA